jgi:hypothetical protein
LFSDCQKTSFSGFLLTKFPEVILIFLFKFPDSTKKVLQSVAKNVEMCFSYLPSKSLIARFGYILLWKIATLVTPQNCGKQI